MPAPVPREVTGGPALIRLYWTCLKDRLPVGFPSPIDGSPPPRRAAPGTAEEDWRILLRSLGDRPAVLIAAETDEEMTARIEAVQHLMVHHAGYLTLRLDPSRSPGALRRELERDIGTLLSPPVQEFLGSDVPGGDASTLTIHIAQVFCVAAAVDAGGAHYVLGPGDSPQDLLLTVVLPDFFEWRVAALAIWEGVLLRTEGNRLATHLSNLLLVRDNLIGAATGEDAYRSLVSDASPRSESEARSALQVLGQGASEPSAIVPILLGMAGTIEQEARAAVAEKSKWIPLTSGDPGHLG